MSLIPGTLKKFFISCFLSSSSVITCSAPRVFSLSVSFWMSGLETKHNPWSHLLSISTRGSRTALPQLCECEILCGKLGLGLSLEQDLATQFHHAPASLGLSFLPGMKELGWVVSMAPASSGVLETVCVQEKFISLPDFSY